MILRWLLTAAVIYVAWENAHWSVAASLTGLAINNEIQALIVRGLIEKVKGLERE